MKTLNDIRNLAKYLQKNYKTFLVEQNPLKWAIGDWDISGFSIQIINFLKQWFSGITVSKIDETNMYLWMTM